MFSSGSGSKPVDCEILKIKHLWDKSCCGWKLCKRCYAARYTYGGEVFVITPLQGKSKERGD